MNEQIEQFFIKEMTVGQKDDLFRQMADNPDLRDKFVSVQNSLALAVSSDDVHDQSRAVIYLRKFKKKMNRKRAMSIVTGFVKYAAILVVGMLIAKGLFLNTQVVETPVMAFQSLTVPAGQRAQLTLSDGTTVWVNAKSTLSYPGVFSEDTREVYLTGEAYFDVADNSEQPFIVKSGNYCTQVTGTQFNVFAYDGFYDVSLIEGQVKVYTTGKEKNAIILKSNEKVTLMPNGVLEKKQSFNTEDFLWKEGIYCFDDMPFAAIVEKLQLYYDVRIHVNNKVLMKHRITGKFRQRDGIETVLKIIQKGYPFVFSKSDDGSNIFIK